MDLEFSGHCNGLDGQVFGVLGGRTPTKYALWSFLVVFPPPGFDDRPGVRNAREPVFVQTLVAQAAIEALDVGVLVWLAGLDRP